MFHKHVSFDVLTSFETDVNLVKTIWINCNNSLLLLITFQFFINMNLIYIANVNKGYVTTIHQVNSIIKLSTPPKMEYTN